MIELVNEKGSLAFHPDRVIAVEHRLKGLYGKPDILIYLESSGGADEDAKNVFGWQGVDGPETAWAYTQIMSILKTRVFIHSGGNHAETDHGPGNGTALLDIPGACACSRPTEN